MRDLSCPHAPASAGDGEDQPREVEVSRTPSPPLGDTSPAAMKVIPAAARVPIIASTELEATALPVSNRRTVATPMPA